MSAVSATPGRPARYSFTRDQLVRILAGLDTHGRKVNAEVMAAAIIREWAAEAVADPPAHKRLPRRMVGRHLEPSMCSCGKPWEACDRERSAESRWTALKDYLHDSARGFDAEEYRAAILRYMDELEGQR